MRKGFNGLAAATRQVIGEDPLSGHLFVFFNRRRDRTKILFWDRSGLCLYYKRIEKGRFHLGLFDARRGRRAEVEAVADSGGHRSEGREAPRAVHAALFGVSSCQGDMYSVDRVKVFLYHSCRQG